MLWFTWTHYVSFDTLCHCDISTGSVLTDHLRQTGNFLTTICCSPQHCFLLLFEMGIFCYPFSKILCLGDQWLVRDSDSIVDIFNLKLK